MQCLILQSFILFSIFIVRKATAYNCINTFGDEDCEIRKKAGECENFPEWMTLSCPLACDKCDQLDSLIKLSSCYDHREDCSSHVTTHKGCEKYPDWMLFHCPSSCGFCEQQANWYAKSFERLGIPLTEDLQQRISKAETNAGGTSPNEAVVGDTGSFESSSKFTLSSTDNGSDECVDKEKDCDIRQRGGQCEEYPVWMSKFCAKSCGCKAPERHPNMIDDGSGCVDMAIDCMERQKTNHCDKYYEWMTDNCPRSCGRCGMKHNLKFMKYEPGAPCEDLDSHECAYIQPEQCINFPMFALRCPVACETCNLLDPAIRCNNDFLKLSTAPAYIPGQMSAVLAGVKRENEHRFGVEVLSQSPWVLQVEEFLLPAEAQAVLESTGGWKAQSELEYVGQNKAVGEIGGLAFCQSRCQKVSKAYMETLAILLRVPVENLESLQFLHLLANDTYTATNEYVPAQVDALYGNVMISGLIYLTDSPNNGILTFPQLDIRVNPAVGRLVLWSVVQADDITAVDTRSEHVFEPFATGDQFVASFNVRVRNFKQVNQWQCGDLYDVNPYEV